MKGEIFVELIRMAEARFGEDVVDEVIERASLPSGGSYTTVGYYSCGELVVLVDAFSKYSGIDDKDLEKAFGYWVIDAFAKSYSGIFAKYPTAERMLESIEREIHQEVRKLYPQSELPTIDVSRTDERQLTLHYRSERPLAFFCLGLVEGCFKKYGQDADIRMQEISAASKDEIIIEIDTSPTRN